MEFVKAIIFAHYCYKTAETVDAIIQELIFRINVSSFNLFRNSRKFSIYKWKYMLLAFHWINNKTVEIVNLVIYVIHYWESF